MAGVACPGKQELKAPLPTWQNSLAAAWAPFCKRNLEAQPAAHVQTNATFTRSTQTVQRYHGLLLGNKARAYKPNPGMSVLVASVTHMTTQNELDIQQSLLQRKQPESFNTVPQCGA